MDRSEAIKKLVELYEKELKQCYNNVELSELLFRQGIEVEVKGDE